LLPSGKANTTELDVLKLRFDEDTDIKKYQMSYENLNTSSSYIFRHLCQDMILVGSCIVIG
jgi:hypothetical protein